MSGAAFEASGVVTLLTDFGLSDPYVGVMKGVMLSAEPRLELIDLTHGVPPQAIAVGAWHTLQSWARFPAGTVHVVVVDPGVGSERRILLAEQAGHLFLAPDNGVLDPALTSDATVRVLDAERFALPGASRTFHGRDVFSPAAAALAGGLSLAEAGSETTDWVRLELPVPEVAVDGTIRAGVLYVDSFGNLVTMIGAELLEGGVSWTAEVGGREMPLLGTYADVGAGELLALVGSNGTVEVSLRDGDAAGHLGVEPGDAVSLRPST